MKTFDRLLAAAALLYGAVIVLRAPGLGDFPTDAGPALSAIGHGNLTGFFAHQPAMGGLSLYLRAPFAMLAVSLHSSDMGVYRWEMLPCVLSIAIVGLWMSRLARSRGTGRIGQILIVAVCVLNPLIDDALYWGHPEEILTASLAVGALLGACERRVVLTAVLAGLAVASKQWALVSVVPAILILERERLRAVSISAAVAAAVTVPMVVGNFAAFRQAFSYITAPQPVMTLFTWLYPFSPTGKVHITNPFGDARTFFAHRVWAIETALSHPLIIVLGILIPVLVWALRAGRPSAGAMLRAVAIVFILRSALDPGSIAYYHLPLLLSLVALDVIAGRRLPVVGIVGFAVSFVALDRVPAYLGPDAANLLYIAASVTAVALLARPPAPGRGLIWRLMYEPNEPIRA